MTQEPQEPWISDSTSYFSEQTMHNFDRNLSKQFTLIFYDGKSARYPIYWTYYLLCEYSSESCLLEMVLIDKN